MKDKELRELLGVEKIERGWKAKDHRYRHLQNLEYSLDNKVADTDFWRLESQVSRMNSALKDARLYIKELEWRIRALEGSRKGTENP